MEGLRHGRTVAGYVVLIGIVAVVVAAALIVGWGRTQLGPIGGTYEAPEGACLGPNFALDQSGRFITVKPSSTTDQLPSGALTLDGTRLAGRVSCLDGSTEFLALDVAGRVHLDKEGHPVSGPTLTYAAGPDTGTPAGNFVKPADVEASAGSELSPEKLLGRLMLAIAAVMLAARLAGAAVARLGQPRVMGEVIAGILLGPSFLGAIAGGDIQRALFPPEVTPLLRGGADIGLVFYMFLVGLELDPELLRGRVEQSAFISHASIAIPMALGMAAAVPLFGVLAAGTSFAAFALFVGVAMSITAFPVLARILIERRMLQRPTGAMALGAAAVDDVTAWVLLALSFGVAKASTDTAGDVPLQVAKVIGLAVLYCAVVAIPVRRLLGRVSTAYDEAGRVPPGWIAAIFAGVLLSAFVTTWIGIAGIFGAFTIGLAMPRRADLSHDVRRRIEDFVSVVLLPLFFVSTGLNTELGLLNRPVLWAITLGIIALAIVCKWAGATGAARFVGIPPREAAAIGALMNTRGLTELIVLNLGLSLHVISPALFSMLVIMALVTTFMTGPILRVIDRDGTLSAPASDQVEGAESVSPEPRRAPPDRVVLVAPLGIGHTDTLLGIAEAVASAEPPREIVLARLLEPSRSPGTVDTERRRLERADTEVRKLRDDLVDRGISARAVAFGSPDIGADLLELASDPRVDLVLLDGRRPLLREGPPRGPVGSVLGDAECDVAVLIERAGAKGRGDGPVLVAFGGAEHDWAALELGAWIASGSDRGLVLLGATGPGNEEEGRDASKLLAHASLLTQRLTGIQAEPRLMAPGRRGVLDAASDAGLLILGLAESWRTEGLGDVRGAIARSSPAPILFVSRGRRPGALATREDVTRFAWSRTRGMPAR